MNSVKELLQSWFSLVARRRGLAETRLMLGIEHAKVNSAVVQIEEELAARSGGTSHFLPDGSLVDIGKPGCRLSERMRVSGGAGPTPAMQITLPTWDEINEKFTRGETLNPIEEFIYDQEPVGEARREFRSLLSRALIYAHTHLI